MIVPKLATQMNPNAQKIHTRIDAPKYTTGTRITLFVFAKKSAEASITSIAYFKLLNPQITQSPNKSATTPKVMPTPNNLF